MESNSGASNASDFQPPTANPQQAPGNVFPQQDGIQESGQTQLLENSSTEIIVPVNPAPAPRTVTEVKSDAGTFVVLAIIIALILLSLHLWRRKKSLLTKPKIAPEPEAAPEVPAAKTVTAGKALSKPSNPAKKAARKAAKRRKRSRK